MATTLGESIAPRCSAPVVPDLERLADGCQPKHLRSRLRCRNYRVLVAGSCETAHVLEIRRVSPGDWPLWREVRLRALEDAPAAFGSTLADWSGSGDVEQRWRERLDAVAANFVAHRMAKPVGQASGTLTEEKERVQLLSMWVAPEARGAGIGDALVQAVESWALSIGARTLVLFVNEANGHAIDMYERHGLVRTPAPVEGGFCEMAKDLG